MIRTWPSVGVVWCLAIASTALGQPNFADLVRNANLTREDKDRIGGWVDEKTAALLRGTAAARARIRDEAVRLYQTAEATPAFREQLAAECGRAWARPASGEDFEVAHTLILGLLEMPSPGVRAGLESGLQSPHAAVRYWAARGIAGLRPQMKSATEYETVLNSLGQAGAAETDPIALRMIYEAIDFPAAAPQFAGAEAVAQSLATVFRGRLERLAGQPRNEEADRAGFAAAARVYPEVKDPALRAQLVTALARFLALHAERYVELGPEGAGPTLSDTAARCEEALRAMIEATRGAPQPPTERVSERMRAKADREATRAALAAWIGGEGGSGVLNQSPWNVPPGLKE